jgi:two-component system response regulator LytT
MKLMNSSKIVIVEDEILIAEHIKDYLESFGFTDISMAHTRKTARELISYVKPDLVFLDINLKEGLEGIQLAAFIDEEIHCPYIFLTANADTLVIQKAIHTRTAAYITKPIRKADLYAAIQLACKTKPQVQSGYIVLKNGYATTRLNINDIIYVESKGNYIQVVTAAEKLFCRQSLEWAREQLPENQFFRTHRSFIINAFHLKKVTYKTAYLDIAEVPVSKANYARILKLMQKTEE